MAVRSLSAAGVERTDAAEARGSADSLPPVDWATQELIRAVKSRLEALYGARLKGLILFGSRARGDFTEASDADLAIVLEPPIGRPFAVKCEVIDATYDLFLDSCILIQPWPLCEQWLTDPEASPYPHLVGAILREGIRV
jgi:predicted nucleotidyltransferase